MSILEYLRLALSTEEKSFTTGSINKALIILGIPIVLEMSMEGLFAIIDLLYISMLDSDDALATIGLVETFMFIIMSIALGIAAAATAMVARRIGEKDFENANYASVQSIGLGIILSLFLGVVGFVFAEDFLRLMGASESLIEEGKWYAKIMLATNIVLVLLTIINAVFRGAGDASMSMRTLWLANGLNIILDPLFIFGWGPFPEMGLTGAAVATSIGRGIGVLYQIYVLTSGRAVIKLTWKHLVVKWDMLMTQIKVAIGGAGQHLLTSSSWIIMIRIVSHFGSQALAGYTIAIRIIMFTILPSWGIAMAAATLVGQNLGANQPERAETSAWRAAFYNSVFLALISISFFIFSKQIIELFSDDPVVIQYGRYGLMIIALGYIAYAYEMVLGQAFNGAGDTYTPTLLNFIAFWLIQIPLAYVLSIYFNLGPNGTYAAIAISSSILALMAIYVFKKGKWKEVAI